ncbi:MAG: hypothetical protein IPK62_07395 [Bacteroidetes bacterium]|nr:hypothetical protein [Bacteroidota bacterium]MBK8144826.1 hypothetical protein [Bacteroidota bacterium]MBP6316077.1 hypothetical protein [Chitinophagaceae bacterium]
MNRKINLFTLVIFAYSVVICATFKKDQGLNQTTTAKVETKVPMFNKATAVKTEPLTVSNAELKNNNQ